VLKFRIITFFILMGIYSLSFQFGATSEVSPEEANEFVQEFLSATQDSDGLAYFVNNVSVSLPMFVPGVGAILGIYSGWSTGFGFAAIATMAPGLANIEPLTLLYYSPYGLIELAAYSIAMSRSFHVVYSLAKKVNPKSLIKPSLIEICIVVGLLVFAGFLEEYMINLAQQGTPLL
jgi:hypothetical protein